MATWWERCCGPLGTVEGADYCFIVHGGMATLLCAVDSDCCACRSAGFWRVPLAPARLLYSVFHTFFVYIIALITICIKFYII